MQKLLLRLMQAQLPLYAQRRHGPIEYGKDIVVLVEVDGEHVLQMYQVKAGDITKSNWAKARDELAEMFQVDMEHYSKLSRWSAFRAEHNILRNFMTRRMRYLKSNGPPGRFESSDQRILKPGRAVALLSYHRPDAHADAGTRPSRERGA